MWFWAICLTLLHLNFLMYKKEHQFSFYHWYKMLWKDKCSTYSNDLTFLLENVYSYVVCPQQWWKFMNVISQNDSWCPTSNLYNACSHETIINHQEEWDRQRKYNPSSISKVEKGNPTLSLGLGWCFHLSIINIIYVFPCVYNFLLKLWNWIGKGYTCGG